ncbi:MAG: HDOD domain-containing protein [Fibrobacterota bacterium]
MRTVIFLDDSGLNLMLYRKMNRYLGLTAWRCFYCDSPADALSTAETYRIDLAVSDLEMPYVDGVHFLDLLAHHSPETIRVIFSAARTDPQELRTVFMTHQYYYKPIDITVLRNLYERTEYIHRLIDSGPVRRSVNALKSLPVPSPVYLRLINYVNESNATVKTVAAIIASDPAATVNLLKLVNTPFFGFSEKISTPLQAVALLGIDMIRSLLIIDYVKQMHPAASPLDYDRLTDRAALGRRIARCIGQRRGLSIEELRLVSLTALVMDIGEYILNYNFPGKLFSWIEQEGAFYLDTREEKVLSLCHAVTGAYLLALWGVQDEIVHLVRNHHRVDCSRCSRREEIIFLTEAVLQYHETGRLSPHFDKNLEEEIKELYYSLMESLNE